MQFAWGISLAGRALPLQGRGHRFESDILHQVQISVYKLQITNEVSRKYKVLKKY